MLFIAASAAVFAQEKTLDEAKPSPNDSHIKTIAERYDVEPEKARFCLRATDDTNDLDKLAACLVSEQDGKKIEQIEVVGRYIGLQIPEVAGKHYLDKSFIDAMPRTTGDINDLIVLLPGVQSAEGALSAENAGEIRAQTLSISGGQPWQTGFFLDGISYNSRQDPGAFDRSIASVNDVTGAPQTFNVNADIVDNIQVFDNNIPARYGYFSAGVVDVEGLSAFSSAGPTLNFSYRGSQSDWGQFHLINGFETQAQSNSEIDVIPLPEDQVPIYKKDSFSFVSRVRINDHHGFMLSANYLKSEVSDVSLQEFVQTKRENTNVLVKYSMRDLWVDSLDWSVMIAPYENSNLLPNVKDSQFTISGGGLASVISVKENFDTGRLDVELSVNESDNSREAPRHYYLWTQAKGVEWGQNDPTNITRNFSLSAQGGYGDIEKTQRTYNLNIDFYADTFSLFGLIHEIDTGFSWMRDELNRTRKNDSYYYNSSTVYATTLDGPQLNCSGYTIDCIPLTYSLPIEQIIAELGGEIDFSDPDDVQAYSNYVVTTPQYFKSRIVYGAEDIDAAINQFSAYVQDSFTVGKLEINAGLRYDYDDFFARHNVAPRFSAGYDIFGEGNTLAVFGVNRYYDAGLLTYRMRELERPYYVEYRPISNGALQGWQRSSEDSDVRYRYADVSTPYNDEVVLGWKQATDYFGTFALNYVYRWQRDQLARAGQTVLDEEGYRIAFQNNSGEGTSERISLSWSAQYDIHSLWANVSYTQNTRNNNDYDNIIDDVPVDELVWLEFSQSRVIDNRLVSGEVISKEQLNRSNTNFSRPITGNAGWTAEWNNSFTTSATVSYTGSYTSAVFTGGYKNTGEIVKACVECEAVSLELPRYENVSFKSRALVDISASYRIPLSKEYGALTLRVDVSNALNSRTYLITPGRSGVETGRKIWLGLNYSL